MIKRHKVNCVQKFTQDGKLGLWLIFCSPIVIVIGIVWLSALLSNPPRFGGQQPIIPALILLVGGAYAQLAGIIFVLIGRVVIFELPVFEEDEASSNS